MTNYLEIIKEKLIVIKEKGVLLILSYIYSFCKIYNNCIIESHLFTSTLDIYICKVFGVSSFLLIYVWYVYILISFKFYIIIFVKIVKICI